MIDDLTRWVQKWALRYPAKHDQVLVSLHDAMALDRAAALTVIDWKFHTWPTVGPMPGTGWPGSRTKLSWTSLLPPVLAWMTELQCA
jgi:hypothetical protein